MFITDQDYKVVIGEQALKVVSQVSPDNRRIAETEAIEEVAGYLRPKYDTDAIFKATGNERNHLIVMQTCDIALYHMTASAPQKMGMEIRKERYERAVKWLEGVQAGKSYQTYRSQLTNKETRSASLWFTDLRKN